MTLRTLLPLLLVFTLLGVGVVTDLLRYKYQVHRLETREVEHVTQVLLRTQANIGRLAAAGDTGEIDRLVARYGSEPDLVALVLVGPDGRVVAATRRAWLGANATDVVPGYDMIRAADARASEQSRVKLDAGGTGIRAWLRVDMPVPPGALRAIESGVLYWNSELTQERDALLRAQLHDFAWFEALSMLVVFVLTWLPLHYRVLRRTQRLERAARTWANGNLAARSGVDGSDELGRVGVAFDRMAVRLREQIETTQLEKARLNAILDTASEAVFIIDTRGGIDYVNPAGLHMFGYARDELIGCNISMLMSGSTREHHDGYLRRFLDTGEKAIIGTIRDEHARRKDGSVFPIELSVNEVHLPHAQLFTGVIRDVSERKRMETELMHARDQALAGLRARTELLNNFNHEWRTPMNGVTGYLELLQDSALDDKNHRLVVGASTSARRLTELLTNLYELAQLDGGAAAREIEPFSPCELVEQLVAACRPAAQHKALELKTAFGLGLPSLVLGDGKKLHTALLQLISNAVKYTSTGQISVTCSVDQHEPGAWWLRFAVDDTGPGVPEHLQRVIFSAFVQADGSATRRHEGAGLGLTISRRLVELLGGVLHLDSPASGGAVFWFVVKVDAFDAAG